MSEIKKKNSKHLYFNLTRRNFIQGATAGAVIVGAPAVLKGLTRRAKAADKGVIRMMFTAPTMIPGDWKQFEKDFSEKGIVFSGYSPDGLLPEIVEITNHPWFLGVQFHPELKSKPFDPHPLFKSFIGAAKEKSRLV